MEKRLLDEIASVQLGYSFRKGVKHDPAGSVCVVQMRDLGEDNVVDPSGLDHVDQDLPQHHALERGDILLRSRGDSVSSAILRRDLGRAVAAAPLLRIRVTDTRILPEFLNWYINQPPAQSYFARHAEGSNVKMISPGALEALPVAIPTLEHQSALVDLAGLTVRERELVRELSRCRSDLLSQITLNYLEGGASR